LTPDRDDFGRVKMRAVAARFRPAATKTRNGPNLHKFGFFYLYF